MTRRFLALLATGLAVVALSPNGATAQQPPAASAPEPQMPPMPSMEGQQGDVSKPVTQIPAKRKGAEKIEKKEGPKAATAGSKKAAGAKGAKPARGGRKAGARKPTGPRKRR